MNEETRAHWDAMLSGVDSLRSGLLDLVLRCEDLRDALQTYAASAEDDWTGHWLESAGLDMDMAESELADLSRELDSAIATVLRVG